MDTDTAIQIAVIILLLFCSAFFSSAETSLMAVNKVKMKTLSQEGDKRADRVLYILDDQAKMLSTILIGNNIVNLTASSMTTVVASKIGGMYVGFATGLLTFLVLIFGEITPKTAATLNADNMALKYSSLILPLMKLLTPVIWIINKLSRIVLTIMGLDPDKKQEAMTEEELRTIVDISHEEGVIESNEKEMITNVFDFGDQSARDIMIPRVDMTCIDVNADYNELIEIFRKDKYTRMPVYEEDTDNIIGIINIKDILLINHDEEFSVRNVMRDVLYTFEYKKVSKLMNDMRKSSCNVSIVVSEYGSCVGMITLEDMLEEIVGEIRDEFDEDEEHESDSICVADGEYLVEGSMRLTDLNEILNTEFESEDFDSIGGYLTELLGHMPETGDSVENSGYKFVADAANEMRVEKVRIFRLDEE